ncbi:MAG: D-amino acid dehydrogenase [Gammaproteobacteria bacterium]|nr:D-amino acid dehydrogenase [Gammaproteobacteria bacterium]
MKIVVLGAGVIGTTTAWFLNQAGHEVTVIERQPNAGLETSFANGGQISVCHAEPWANPSAPKKILQWLGKEDAPLLFRLRADINQWRWGWQFLKECSPTKTRQNTLNILRLGLYSRGVLQKLRADTNIKYDELTKGILHFYTDPKEFEDAIVASEFMRNYGCDRNVIDKKSDIVAIEPAFANSVEKIVGATFTASDESGDAQKFTNNLSVLAAAKGVNFLFDHTITHIKQSQGRVSGVTVKHHEEVFDITADVYVVCLASYSALMVRDLGISLLIYPAKGYSATVEVPDGANAPMVSMTDDEYKLVFSRLGNRLRIAGTAELNGYNLNLNDVRCQALIKRTAALFPAAADYSKPLFWTGLRPATPSNVPYIGKTKFPNLYLNTGHGTLGWTHSCGSAQAIADIIDGKKPDVEFDFV